MSAISEKSDGDQVESVNMEKVEVSDTSPERLDGNELQNVNEQKTLRKIDYRVIPMVTILYLLSWLDRG